MKTCYLCNIELTEENDHGEHIFQQALGGTLIEKGILCKECGNKLGKDVDVKFTSIFRNYTSRLPINFDRNTKKESEKGYIYIPKFNREFEFKAVKEDLYPIKSYAFLDPEDKSRLIIIHPKSKKKSKLKEYINLQKRKFNITNDSDISIIQKFNDYEYIWHIPFNLGSVEYKKGMAKIAIGFAIKNGIKREELDCVLDCNNNKIQDRIALLPYFPKDFIHDAIEEARFKIDNLEYLSHQIKLFNKGNILNCYIELFGTFQCYVLLSENYTGQDIYYSYMQPIFKRNRIGLPHLPRKHKDLLLYKDLLPKNESLSYTEETRKKIDEILRKQPNKLDVEEYYSGLIDYILMNLYLCLNKDYKDSYELYKLQDFFKQKSMFIEENLIDILKDLAFFHENSKYIKQDIHWGELASIVKICKSDIYKYNERKMKRLEEIIYNIQQNNQNHLSIWKIEY